MDGYIGHDMGYAETKELVVEPEPHKLLIDQLSVRSLLGLLDRTEALLILRDVRNNICPVCGDGMSSYHVVFGQPGPGQPMSIRGVFFRHAGYPSSILSCYRDFRP